MGLDFRNPQAKAMHSDRKWTSGHDDSSIRSADGNTRIAVHGGRSDEC